MRGTPSAAKIVIARAGRPVARLVPYRARTSPRIPGQWRGRVGIAPDFDQTDSSLLDVFELILLLDAHTVRWLADDPTLDTVARGDRRSVQ